MAAAIVCLLFVLWTGAPDDGVSPMREAWPSPKGDEPVEGAWGVYPTPVLFIVGSGPDHSSARSYG
jgi:hypothetical protein